MKRFFYICTPLRYKSERKRPGEVTEWSNVPVLKTGVPKGTGGSNPSFTARANFRIRQKFTKPARSKAFSGFFVFQGFQNMAIFNPIDTTIS